MAQSWLRKLLKRKSKSPRTGRDPKARRWTRLALEPLEDRTLLSVSVVQNSTNNYSVLGTAGDNVWFKTTGSAVQYSTNGTNYSNVGSLSVASDASLVLGMMNQVHLSGITGQGHALQIQALGASSGAVGQLASPTLLTVDANIDTKGGALSILNMQGIEVSSGVNISTRNIGSSTDYLRAASVGNSGALKLTSENPDTFNPILNIGFNHPHVTVGSGARLLAQVDEGSSFTAGDVTLSAQNTNFSLGAAAFSG